MKRNPRDRKDGRKSRRNVFMAGVVAAALALSLLLGICRGSFESKEERRVADEQVRTEKQEQDRPQEQMRQAEPQPEQKTEEQKTTEFSALPEQEREEEQKTEESVGITENVKEEQSRHQVGDILEDGSMYTGGDVEAGLEYIRENPEIWDQLVWH